MRLTIPYGEAEKSFELREENLWRVVAHDAPRPPGIEDEQLIVREALRRPVAASLIGDMVKPTDRVVVLADDWTRPTPIFKVMPLIVEELEQAGVKDEQVSVVVARGTHRRLSEKELRQKLGSEALNRFEVRNHENDRDLIHLGVSRRGTPVWVNRLVAEAHRRIAVGGILTHPLAGYGGGAKIVLPGVSGVDTINHNHSMIDDVNARVGVLDGNPVREDMDEAARMARLDFIVNLVLNERKEILHAVAGDVVQAHREAARLYDRLYGVQAADDADVVVLGSSPRDATFAHATFSLYAAVPLVKPGGTIILVAPCEEGPGSREMRLGFKGLLSVKPEELMALMKTGEVDASGGAFDYCYSKVVNRNRVVLVSDNYSKREAEELGVGYAPSVQEALDDALRSGGAEAKVTILPTGGLTVPLSGHKPARQ